MKPNDKNIAWVKEPQLGLAGRSYLLLFAQGLTTTLKHLFRRKIDGPVARSNGT